MITAMQANANTKRNIENGSTTELKDISNKIEKAVNAGEFSISCSGYLSRTSVDKLKELGYFVSIGCKKNETYYLISWDNSSNVYEKAEELMERGWG